MFSKMKSIMIIFVLTTFTEVQSFHKSLILFGNSSNTAYTKSLNQDQTIDVDGHANLSNYNQSGQISFFSVPFPPPPSPPTTVLKGPTNSQFRQIQNKNSQQCLYYSPEANYLGFRDCTSADANQLWKFEDQFWQFQLNGHIVLNSTGLCIYNSDKVWGLLGITQCNEQDLSQVWIQEDCQDNFCAYKNQGFSQLQGKNMCLSQDGGADLKQCFVDGSQLFTFYHPPPSSDILKILSSYIGVVIIVTFSILLCCYGIGQKTNARQGIEEVGEYQQWQQQSRNYGGDGSMVINNNYNNSNIVGGRGYRHQQNQRENDELQEELLEHRIQDSLISETFEGASTVITCCICLDELKDGDRETILPCTHQFHKKCFDEWLQKQGSKVACPLCNLHLKDTISP